MQLLTPQQIHDWDAYTIAHEPITSFNLMERAAGKCTAFLLEKKLLQHPISIFCGKGNNGGDGLAIARQLIEAGYNPAVYILELGAVGTADFQQNLHILHTLTKDIHFIQSADFFPQLTPNHLIIDALYGSGLNRPLEHLSAMLVNHINVARATVIAIDVPSGLFIDKSASGYPIIKAAITLTFQVIKLCFLLAENSPFFGEVHVLEIGLDANYLSNIQTKYTILSRPFINLIYKKRNAFAHKGSNGHCLLLAGSFGKTGAAILAAKACLRTGTGLLTAGLTQENIPIMQTVVPEAMCINRENAFDTTIYTTIAIGPGLGINETNTQLMMSVLQAFRAPIVLDADAITIIANYPVLKNFIPKGAILTPHPKEFDRLFGKTANDVERIEKAILNAANLQCYIILKGHHTFIACPDGCGYFNNTGNAGLAKGGSGDVLTGMLAALLAQGYPPLHAALFGVYLHGLAADTALASQSMESMIATDLIEHIGTAYYQINNAI